ncbi:MAG TPA: hypothetical protein VF520_15415 [Thermoleophilaceae bacterium]|jgi:hypothetical protein
MDAANLFDTPATFRAVRLEYAVGLAVSVFLLAWHVEDVRILPAILLFAYSDVVGYLPGAVAYRRSPDGRIARGYYVAYNVAHSFVTAAVVAGLWALLVEPEWALLIVAAHLCGDRALFGNVMKPFSVAFEPEPHPVWKEVAPRLERPAPGAPAAIVAEDEGRRAPREPVAPVS